MVPARLCKTIGSLGEQVELQEAKTSKTTLGLVRTSGAANCLVARPAVPLLFTLFLMNFAKNGCFYKFGSGIFYKKMKHHQASSILCLCKEDLLRVLQFTSTDTGVGYHTLRLYGMLWYGGSVAVAYLRRCAWL